MRLKIDKRFSYVFKEWRYFVWYEDVCADNFATEEEARNKLRELRELSNLSAVHIIHEENVPEVPLDEKKLQPVCGDLARTDPEGYEQEMKR